MWHDPEKMHDLFVVLGTSATALIGLLFIASSLHLKEVVDNPRLYRRAYNNTCYLLIVLVEALALLLPQPMALLGGEILMLNVVGLLFLYGFAIAFFKDRKAYIAAGGQPQLAIMFASSFAIGAGGGTALIFQHTWGAYLVALSCTVLIVRVVLTAWLIMVRIGKPDA